MSTPINGGIGSLPQIYHGLSNCFTRLGMSTPITSSICGLGGAGAAGSRHVQCISTTKRITTLRSGLKRQRSFGFAL